MNFVVCLPLGSLGNQTARSFGAAALQGRGAAASTGEANGYGAAVLMGEVQFLGS